MTEPESEPPREPEDEPGEPAPPPSAADPELVPGPELRRGFVWLCAVLYLLMFLGAVAGNQYGLETPRSFLRISDEAGTRVLGWTAVTALGGVACGLGVVGLGKLLGEWWVFRSMMDYFVSVLGAMTWRDAFYIALFSSVAEEALFRGVLQNAVGLHWASLTFGCIHFLPRIWHWSVFAIGMGYLFGGLYLWSGDLMAPIACHFTINFINLQLIGRRARELGIP